MSVQTPYRPVVVIAEDEALLRMTAADILDEAGYETIQAADADAALAILKCRPDVSVLFTDIQMPGPLDGLELARLVHERWPEVLLLITSGNTFPPRGAIPDDGRFLRKPYRAAEIVGQIDELVRRDK
jgi:two-component system, response regulator PdtaR